MGQIYRYYLLAILFTLISCVTIKSEHDCEKFKKGRFRSRSEFDNSVSIIHRTDSFQIESNSSTGDVLKAKIKWLSNCEYELEFISESSNAVNKIDTFIAIRPLKTVILKTTRNYYIFKSTMEGSDVALTDTLEIIK